MVAGKLKWQHLLFIQVLCFVGGGFAQDKSTHATRQLGDRLLMKLDFKVFTQRQMELYLGLREVLLNSSGEFIGVQAENWQESLEQFRQEMAIAAEISKQDLEESPAAGQASLSQGLAKLEAYATQSLPFRHFREALAISPTEERLLLAEILKAAQFREKKKLDQSWNKEISNHHQLYWFQASETYQAIIPPRASE